MQSYADKLKDRGDDSSDGDEYTYKIGPRIENLTSRRSANYVFWELTYREHLLELRDMYAEVVTRMNPDLKMHIYSPSFFNDFSRMLWENSSTEISENT
jgi:hypothetical protein